MNYRRHFLRGLILASLILAFLAPHAWGAYNVKKTWIRVKATAGEALDTGELVCIKDSDGYAYQADANDSDLRPAIGVVGSKTASASGKTVEIIITGKLSGWSSLTEGQLGYLSETAAAVTQSAPTWSQPVGIALSTTEYFFDFCNYFDSSSLTALGTLSGATPIILEGATADAYETTISVTDPTADRTVTVADGSGTVMLSSLATNAPDAANAVTGASNGLVYEGSTANDYETTVSATDPTADRTVTIPNDSGTICLAIGADDAANAAWFANNALVFEGSSADAHETTFSVTNPTADRTITVPNEDVALEDIADHETHITTTQAFLNLPMGAWTEQDGTAIADFSAGDSTVPGWEAATETHGIRWNNHGTPDPISCSVPIPPDLDSSADVVVHIMAAKTGNTLGDAVTWTIEAFNNADGALYDADTDFGGTSSAMTGNATAKTCQEETLTLAAANVAGSPCVLTLTLQPTDGTLGTDDVIVMGVWLEYTRAELGS